MIVCEVWVSELVTFFIINCNRYNIGLVMVDLTAPVESERDTSCPNFTASHVEVIFPEGHATNILKQMKVWYDEQKLCDVTLIAGIDERR